MPSVCEDRCFKISWVLILIPCRLLNSSILLQPCRPLGKRQSSADSATCSAVPHFFLSTADFRLAVFKYIHGISTTFPHWHLKHASCPIQILMSLVKNSFTWLFFRPWAQRQGRGLFPLWARSLPWACLLGTGASAAGWGVSSPGQRTTASRLGIVNSTLKIRHAKGRSPVGERHRAAFTFETTVCVFYLLCFLHVYWRTSEKERRYYLWYARNIVVTIVE